MFDIGFPRDWSSLKKLIWLKAAISGGGASAVWKTVTGTLIHVTDALASPMQKCEVTLEPIQDLHGQDAPYPAGGGVNILTLPDADFTIKNVRYVSKDGIITLNGTSTGETSSTTDDFRTNWSFVLPAGTYYFFRNTFETPTALIHRVNGVNTPIVTNTGSFTLTEAETVWIGFYVYQRTYNNVVPPLQLEEGSTPTAFKPVSNICPITGWTGCEVNDAGKNLLNVGSNLTNRAGWNMYIPVSLKAGVTYTMSCQNLLYIGGTNRGAKVGIANSSKSLIADLHNVYSYGASVKSFSFTLTEKQAKSAEWIVIQPTSSGVTVEEISDMENMIEVGETATSYVAYSGTTLSVTFPDTVYGGSYEFVNGLLGDEYELITLDGITNKISGRWGETGNGQAFYFTGIGIRSLFEPVNGVFSNLLKYTGNSYGGMLLFSFPGSSGSNITCSIVLPSDVDTVAKANTYLQEMVNANTPIQVLRKRTAKVETQLTGQSISTLKGENNVWSNSNADTTIIYKAQAE